MKWFLQFFVAPLVASVLALFGNYYFFHKPLLSQEYTRMGLDILRDDAAPMHIREFAYQVLNLHSPIQLSQSERDERLSALLSNVPLDDEFAPETWGEMAGHYIVLLNWAREIALVCPECVDTDSFQINYTEQYETIFGEESKDN